MIKLNNLITISKPLKSDIFYDLTKKIIKFVFTFFALDKILKQKRNKKKQIFAIMSFCPV